jgi:hypothetical protein
MAEKRELGLQTRTEAMSWQRIEAAEALSRERGFIRLQLK